MAIWSTIFGSGIKPVADAAKSVVEVFKPNAEKTAERTANYDLAALDTAASITREELRSLTPPTNWFDSAVNGAVRLMRPTCFALIMYPVVLAVRDPEAATVVFAALTNIPPWYATLVSIVVGGLWGAREWQKSRDSKHQLAHAKEALEHIRQVRAMAAASKPKPPSKQVRTRKDSLAD